MSAEEEIYVKLNRAFFAETMPEDMKRVFMLIINKTALPADQKLFLCDYIHNYENINDYARGQLLDVIDELKLFVENRQINISG
jgi:hypothetical protein